MLKKILIFFISAHLCASENIKKLELAPQNNSSMKAIGTGLAAWVMYIIIPNLLEGTNKEQLAEAIGPEGVKLVLFAGAAVCIYELKEIAYIGKDFFQYCYPDEDKKERNRQARETIAILDTKRVSRECLIKNAKGQRNKEDIPVGCEECGDTFAATARTAAFQDMAETFKWAYLRTERLAQLDNKGVKISDELATGLENGATKISAEGVQKSQVPLLKLMH